MSSTSFISFPLTIIFLFLSSHFIAANHLIQQTCRTCSQTDPNISYKFCLNTLQADRRAHYAGNLTELGLVSVKLVRRNVSETRVHIEKLLKKKNLDSYVKVCLNDCLEVYSDAISTLREAIRDYRAGRYEDSNIKVSSVLDDASTCEDGFGEKGVVSPLTKRNNNVSRLSAIALSIINMLS